MEKKLLEDIIKSLGWNIPTVKDIILVKTTKLDMKSRIEDIYVVFYSNFSGLIHELAHLYVDNTPYKNVPGFSEFYANIISYFLGDGYIDRKSLIYKAIVKYTLEGNIKRLNGTIGRYIFYRNLQKIKGLYENNPLLFKNIFLDDIKKAVLIYKRLLFSSILFKLLYKRVKFWRSLLRILFNCTHK